MRRRTAIEREDLEMLRTDAAPPGRLAGRGGVAIEARVLVMRYGDREVLHGIDLVVPHGMVLGSWGPTAPARPPPWRSLRATGGGPPATSACWAWTRPAAGAIWPDVRKLLVWLAVGLLVALRTFRWERAA